MSKKWKILLGVLAVLIVLCLWYTRPRSFEDLAGDWEVKSFAASAVDFGNRGGQAYSESWTVDDREGPENVCGELGAIMKSCKYRVSLWDSLLVNVRGLFSGWYSPPGDKNAHTMVQLGAVLEDESTVHAIYNGSTVTFMADSTLVARASDKEIGDKLLAYIQKFGWK